MTERVRPYLFYDVALTICSKCFRKLEGKIVFQGNKVFLLKHCPEHGAEQVLVARTEGANRSRWLGARSVSV